MSIIQPEELQALVERIIKSGELGRSRTYSDILNYLADCAVSGNTPKEVAIAIDVLGRENDFDVGKDSIVRVHIYHLRNKLKAYFSKYGRQEKYHLDIPKGQYILTAIPANEADGEQAASIYSRRREAMTPWLAALAVLLLFLNLVFQLEDDSAEVPDSPFVLLSPWKEMLDDTSPILILVGDYFIFGEMNAQGDVDRLVREFDVNSSEDLNLLQDGRVAGSELYYDLGLNYIPSSTAFALSRLITGPLHNIDSNRLNVKLVSDYSTADLANNHIVYLGYLSGLQELYALMFAGSSLEIGDTYDELSNLQNGEYYISNSGLSGPDAFKDYSLLVSFPSPSGHQISMISGMRDESLINIAQQASDPQVLSQIEQNLEQVGDESIHFEALFEVFGFDNTNFNSRLIYTYKRDPLAVQGFFGGN
jgi:hypothetical protein